jgi:hypothetical protein
MWQLCTPLEVDVVLQVVPSVNETDTVKEVDIHQKLDEARFAEEMLKVK